MIVSVIIVFLFVQIAMQYPAGHEKKERAMSLVRRVLRRGQELVYRRFDPRADEEVNNKEMKWEKTSKDVDGESC